MLPAGSRLRTPEDFGRTLREGVRCGRKSLVMHIRPSGNSWRAGFIVSKAVGNAVARNRVKRRLRHLIRAELSATTAEVDIVVRALPTAVGNADLAGELSSALKNCMDRLAA